MNINAIIITREYWENSPLSIARHYGSGAWRPCPRRLDSDISKARPRKNTRPYQEWNASYRGKETTQT